MTNYPRCEQTHFQVKLISSTGSRFFCSRHFVQCVAYRGNLTVCGNGFSNNLDRAWKRAEKDARKQLAKKLKPLQPQMAFDWWED